MTEAREKSVLPFRLPVCGPSPRLLSRVEAARYVGISPTSFDSMVEAGTMPRPRRALPTCRKVFDKVELDAAIDTTARWRRRGGNLRRKQLG